MDSRKDLIRKILIVLAILVLVLLGYGAYQSYLTSKRGTIIADSVPGDLDLTLNGKNISTTGKLIVTPGTYKVVAKRSGFSDLKEEFTIKAKETRYLYMYLEPDSDEGEKWMRDHPQEALKLEGLLSERHDKNVEKAVEKNEFITKLPFIGPGFSFRIDYGGPVPGNKYPDAPTIYIQGATEENRQLALRWMRSRGYDPDKMNIVMQEKQPE